MAEPASYGALSPVYEVMGSLLGWVFHLVGKEPMNYILGIFIVATLVSLLITMITNKVVDQKRMKANKEEMKEYQKKMKELRKKGKTKELNRLNKEMMSMQGEMFTSSFKPMLYTIVPIILILSWLSYYLPNNPELVELPFSLPYFGDHLGWFGWYILSSLSVSPVLRKILRMEM